MFQKTKNIQRNSARVIRFLGTSLFIYDFFLIILSLNVVEFNFVVFKSSTKQVKNLFKLSRYSYLMF